MSTTTSRMQLTKPDVSDSMATGATVLSTNYDLIDSVCGAATFTSGTRPSSASTRWAGRLIYESDTTNVSFWDGTTWKYFGSATAAKQYVTNFDPGTQSNIGTTETVLTSGTTSFTATQNRRYRIDHMIYGEHGSAVTGGYIVRIRIASGASVTTSSTLLREMYVKCNSSLTTGAVAYDMVEYNHTAATGQVTVGFFVLSNDANTVGFNGATDAVDIQGRVTIRDWSA